MGSIGLQATLRLTLTTWVKDSLGKAQERADRQMREHWNVEGGALVQDDKRGSQRTVKDYGHFELRAEVSPSAR